MGIPEPHVRDESQEAHQLPLYTPAHLRFAVYFNIRDDGDAYPCGTRATGFSTIGMLPCNWTPAKPSFAVWRSLP